MTKLLWRWRCENVAQKEAVDPLCSGQSLARLVALPNYHHQAQQQRDRMINEARGEYNRVIPRARGEAQQAVLQAEGYALDRVNLGITTLEEALRAGGGE